MIKNLFHGLFRKTFLPYSGFEVKFAWRDVIVTKFQKVTIPYIPASGRYLKIKSACMSGEYLLVVRDFRG